MHPAYGLPEHVRRLFLPVALYDWLAIWQRCAASEPECVQEQAVIPLLLVVALAFAVEAALGFGSTLITVSLGAWLIAVPELLPMYLPLGLGLSAWIVWQDRAALDGRLLGREVLPWMALGLPLGQWAVAALPASALTRLLGVLVAGAASRELWVAARGLPQAQPPQLLGRAVLVLGGAAHGAFGTGGPFVVWLLGQRGLDKQVFRATLSALWLALNTALLITWLVQGRLTAASLQGTAWLAGGALVGSLAGQQLFVRLAPERFRVAVFAMLLLAGLALLVK